MTELEAIKHGYNRKGSCGCHWHSIRFAKKCPEHGTSGESLPTIDDLYAKAALLDELVKASREETKHGRL